MRRRQLLKTRPYPTSGVATKVEMMTDKRWRMVNLRFGLSPVNWSKWHGEGGSFSNNNEVTSAHSTFDSFPFPILMTGEETGFHRIAVLQVAPFVSPSLFAIHIVANLELAKESSHPGISDAVLLIQARGNILFI